MPSWTVAKVRHCSTAARERVLADALVGAAVRESIVKVISAPRHRAVWSKCLWRPGASSSGMETREEWVRLFHFPTCSRPHGAGGLQLHGRNWFLRHSDWPATKAQVWRFGRCGGSFLVLRGHGASEFVHRCRVPLSHKAAASAEAVTDWLGQLRSSISSRGPYILRFVPAFSRCPLLSSQGARRNGLYGQVESWKELEVEKRSTK